MASLSSKTRSLTLFDRLSVADRFGARARGLLGRAGLAADEALWINPCNGIHTFFMMFPIDCVFVDRDLRIKKIFSHVRPWRIIPIVWGARSVFEMPSGAADRLGLRVGEELHVGA